MVASSESAWEQPPMNKGPLARLSLAVLCLVVVLDILQKK